MAWTTTPWTIPANMALAVGKDIDYVLVKLQSQLDKNNQNIDAYITQIQKFEKISQNDFEKILPKIQEEKRHSEEQLTEQIAADITNFSQNISIDA